jgi:hypothetical protein
MRRCPTGRAFCSVFACLELARLRNRRRQTDFSVWGQKGREDEKQPDRPAAVGQAPGRQGQGAGKAEGRDGWRHAGRISLVSSAPTFRAASRECLKPSLCVMAIPSPRRGDESNASFSMEVKRMREEGPPPFRVVGIMPSYAACWCASNSVHHIGRQPPPWWASMPARRAPSQGAMGSGDGTRSAAGSYKNNHNIDDYQPMLSAQAGATATRPHTFFLNFHGASLGNYRSGKHSSTVSAVATNDPVDYGERNSIVECRHVVRLLLCPLRRRSSSLP